MIGAWSYNLIQFVWILFLIYFIFYFIFLFKKVNNLSSLHADSMAREYLWLTQASIFVFDTNNLSSKIKNRKIFNYSETCIPCKQTTPEPILLQYCIPITINCLCFVSFFEANFPQIPSVSPWISTQKTKELTRATITTLTHSTTMRISESYIPIFCEQAIGWD